MARRATTAVGRIEIEVDDDEAPEGVITPVDGREHRFVGWIELAGAIEAWRTEERRRRRIAGDPGTTSEAGDQAGESSG